MPNLFKLFLYLFLSFYQFKTIAAASCDLGPIANCASSSVESISLGTSLSGAKCVENC